jgi:hypothetical protein
VVKGGNQTFSATVTGTNNPAQTVTWSVSGGGTGTSINTGGVLTVAANESAVSLTVTATSTVDTAKSGTAEAIIQTVVNAFDLTALLTAPAKGAAPVTTAINTAQYTGTVAWQTSSGAAFTGGTFAAASVYKALVTFNAKSGYTFTGVAANSFTYTGATATNTANSGTVTLTFPATAQAAGSADITVGFAYGEITITGSDGNNVISKSGTNSPISLSLSASGYTDVVWYVDGNAAGISGTAITIGADAYRTGSHTVTFTGKRGGVPYARVLPFTVEE